MYLIIRLLYFIDSCFGFVSCACFLIVKLFVAI